VKALVTGIAGFTGLHLAEFLLGRGLEIVGTVFSSGRSASLSHLGARVTLVECDVCDVERTRAVVRDAHPDYVFHLAGRTTGRFVSNDLRSTFDANVFGTLSLLEAVRQEAGEAVVLVPGSSAEYGLLLPDTGSVREIDPLRPVNAYAVSKIAQGMVVLQAHLANGQKTVRTRTFNCIGPGQGDAFVCSAFAKQIAEIERGSRPPVIEVGNLDASRDFIDVRDVAEAYWLAATRGLPGDVYNVCSGRSHVIGDTLKTLLTMSEVAIEVKQDPTRMQPSEVPVQVGDFDKLRERTGWEPRIAIEASLADTLAGWRSALAS